MRTSHRISRWTLPSLCCALLGASLLTACPRHRDVAAELEPQIERYRKDPSDALAARIDASFAHLDADVAEIRADAATKTGDAQASALARADALEENGSELRKSYYAVRVGSAAEAAKSAVKQFGASVGRTIQDAGEKMKNALGDDSGEE